MSGMVWLHEDALGRDHPVFAAAGPGCDAFFVWDEAYLRDMDYGFKRLVFIYETLVDLPLTVLRGDTRQCLSHLAGERGGRIFVPDTPNPHLRRIIEDLQRDFCVDVVAAPPFVELPREPDLKRFFRYWNRARKYALSPGGGGADSC